ncbi:MAG: PIN domain-containing protein [Candidatus Altiarchaeota archaeon]
MEIKEYFFDTYALYEIAKGNKDYDRFKSGIAVITTHLNLMELYYGLLLRHDEKTAERYYDVFKGYVVEITDDIIKQAMKLKKQHKEKNLSYVDCIGYTISLQRNIKFLTGDKEFKNLPNVEYVK